MMPAEQRVPEHCCQIAKVEITTKTLWSGGRGARWPVRGAARADRAAARAAAGRIGAVAASGGVRLARRGAVAVRRVARIAKHDKDAMDRACRAPASMGRAAWRARGGCRAWCWCGGRGRARMAGRARSGGARRGRTRDGQNRATTLGSSVRGRVPWETARWRGGNWMGWCGWLDPHTRRAASRPLLRRCTGRGEVSDACGEAWHLAGRPRDVERGGEKACEMAAPTWGG